jgi:hypothetical protein
MNNFGIIWKVVLIVILFLNCLMFSLMFVTYSETVNGLSYTKDTYNLLMNESFKHQSPNR